MPKNKEPTSIVKVPKPGARGSFCEQAHVDTYSSELQLMFHRCYLRACSLHFFANRQIPYDYYSLPYCHPRIHEEAENIGERLTGDRIENSLYKLEAKNVPYQNLLTGVSLRLYRTKVYRRSGGWFCGGREACLLCRSPILSLFWGFR